MDLGIWFFIATGFVAQMVDGSMGMGYGVISNSILLGLGMLPAVASSSVHTAEIFTTGVSGWSHFKLGNVNKQLFKRLVIPGIIGGVVGAYLLSNIDGNILKPYIAIYLILMGGVIIWRAYNFTEIAEHTPAAKKVMPLGLVGGFFDAVGGGGWGPIVTSTLVARNHDPHKTVGSVNAAEFFVTLCQSITFILALGFTNWQIILGLLIGGVLAAPLAAWLCKKTPSKKLMVLVGVLIIILSARTLYLTWF